jgi:hypothetical protein
MRAEQRRIAQPLKASVKPEAEQAAASAAAATAAAAKAKHAAIKCFSSIVEQLLSKNIQVLCIQSPMDSRKTYLLLELIGELERRLGRPVRVLIVTYRTALALSMMKSLEALGFVNYLDVKGTDKLQLVDKCIVQLDSLGMVLRSGCIIPQYDLVVMDESESTLHHATAATLKTNQRRVFDELCSTINIADSCRLLQKLGDGCAALQGDP